MEIPAAFREIAEKSVSQAKETYEKMKSAAEEATDMLEDTYATATKGASDYGLKMIEAARENTNSTFDFATQFDDGEVALGDGRRFPGPRIRASSSRRGPLNPRSLVAIAQKAATDLTEPVKESFGKAFKKAG